MSAALINEIFKPSFNQMEVSYGDSEKIYRSTESVDITQLIEGAREVKSKVLEAIQEEMIDYGTIDDVIMSEEMKTDDEKEVNVEKPTMTQIECSAQSEMDEKNESRMKIEDITGDNATVFNASIKCSRSLMSINCRSSVVSKDKNREEQTDYCNEKSLKSRDFILFLFWFQLKILTQQNHRHAYKHSRTIMM